MAGLVWLWQSIAKSRRVIIYSSRRRRKKQYEDDKRLSLTMRAAMYAYGSGLIR